MGYSSWEYNYDRLKLPLLWPFTYAQGTIINALKRDGQDISEVHDKVRIDVTINTGFQIFLVDLNMSAISCNSKDQRLHDCLSTVFLKGSNSAEMELK